MLIPEDITSNLYIIYMFSASLQKIKHQLENQETMDLKP